MTAGVDKSGPVLVLLLWLAVLVWLTPPRVILRGDDFGYVDSVVRTVQAERLRASPWLEPFNLPLTLLSAISFVLTENFYVSTIGLNLALAVVNVILLSHFLKPAVPADRARWLIVLGLALSPVWLNKALEYTGVPLGLAFTLAAWLCWRRGWWISFFACVAVGVLNRQSSLCLLAWPLVTLIRQWRTRENVSRILPVGIVATLVVALAASLLAPPTWAREMVNRGLREGISPGGFAAHLALAFVFLAGWQAVWGCLRGEAPGPLWRMNLSRPALPLLCTLLGTGLVLGGWAELRWEAPGMERFSLLLLVGATMAGAWLNRWDRLPPVETLVFLSGYGVLVSLRTQWWDYYLFEPLLAVMGAPGALPASSARSVRWPGVWLLLGLGVVSAMYGKFHLQELEAKTVAYERAWRAGELHVTELSDAPFGYLGWKLLAPGRARLDAVKLSDFLKFVEGARAKFDQGAFTVNREGGRKSIHPSRERWVLPADYVAPLLPLDNEEWRKYIRSAPVK